MTRFQPSPYGTYQRHPYVTMQGYGGEDYGAWTDYVPGVSYAQSVARGAVSTVTDTARGAVKSTVRAAQEYLPESIKSGLGVGTSPDYYARNATTISFYSSQPLNLNDAYGRAIWWVQLARNRADFDGKKEAAAALTEFGKKLTSEQLAGSGIWCLFDPASCLNRSFYVSSLYTRVADTIERSGLSVFDTQNIGSRLRAAAARAQTWDIASTALIVAATGAAGYGLFRLYRGVTT